MTVEYVGPFERWSVTVDGWEVPHLDALPIPGGKVTLTVDRRYGLDLTVDEAERFIPFLAQAIAVASGYSCHPSDDREPVKLPASRRLHALDDLNGDGHPAITG